MPSTPFDDADIVTVVAIHPPDGNRMTFERVRQDRRTYYRLVVGSYKTPSITNAANARVTIAYWRESGWIVE